MEEGRWKKEDGRWKKEDGRWLMEDGRPGSSPMQGEGYGGASLLGMEGLGVRLPLGRARVGIIYYKKARFKRIIPLKSCNLFS
jgi:hypothetical protein